MASEVQGCDLKTCYGCKWFAKDSCVCCNDASEHLADFVMPNDVCPEWEGKKSRKTVIANLEKVREEIRTASPELWALASKKVRLIIYVDEALELLKGENDD